MTNNELFYTLALQNVSKIGDVIAKKLISSCGSAEAVFNEKQSNLIKIDGIGGILIKNLQSSTHLVSAETELKFIKANHIKVNHYKDNAYPERLKHCVDSPILLFQRGAINLDNQRIISVVGTREITTQGIQFCEKLIKDLKVYNPIIVSGYAYGTDITAHKAAIKQGLQTIACLAHGFNDMYPKPHSKYVSQMEANGGFFTDFRSVSKFDRNNFLKRNRIIAGLSQATIVIESAYKGGSLVTADIANSYNRDVFAVPGRITDKKSIGCNNLIKQHKAHVLTTPLDVPYILNWDLKKQTKALQKSMFVDLKGDEKAIYDMLILKGKLTLDALSILVHIPTYKLASLLLTMELKDVVRPLPGKTFEAV